MSPDTSPKNKCTFDPEDQWLEANDNSTLRSSIWRGLTVNLQLSLPWANWTGSPKQKQNWSCSQHHYYPSGVTNHHYQEPVWKAVDHESHGRQTRSPDSVMPYGWILGDLPYTITLTGQSICIYLSCTVLAHLFRVWEQVHIHSGIQSNNVSFLGESMCTAAAPGGQWATLKL
jgi:hypothetical protein